MSMKKIKCYIIFFFEEKKLYYICYIIDVILKNKHVII